MVEIAEYARDVYRFITAYSPAMASTPHMYISALAWLPTHSDLSATMTAKLPLSLIPRGRQGDCDSCFWTQRMPQEVDKVEVISEGHQVFVTFRWNWGACILDSDSGKRVWELPVRSGGEPCYPLTTYT